MTSEPPSHFSLRPENMALYSVACFNSERLDRKQFDRNEHFSPFEFCLATGPLSTLVERRLKQANE